MSNPPTDRAAARLAWTRQMLGAPDLELTAASSDASSRSYWRTNHDGRSLVVMDAPPAHNDIRPWLDIGQRLARVGVHVPAVHASDAERGFVLMEDFGQRLYLAELDEHSVAALYSGAMDTLLTMQTRADIAGLPDYDATMLHRELELMPTWFLTRHLDHAPDAAQQQVLADAFDALIANASAQPRCFVHRDYHSRNLMLTGHDDPGVIDFQGAVRGPLTYDLASLLRDCYIAWDEKRVTGWADGYRRRLIDARLLARATDADTFQRWFDLMGLQRHIKVLGIFCRLAYRDGKHAYLSDLPRVLDYVLRVAARYGELSNFVELLRRATANRDVCAVVTPTDGTTTCAR